MSLTISRGAGFNYVPLNTDNNCLSVLRTVAKVAKIAVKLLAAIAVLGVGGITIGASALAGCIAMPLWAAIPVGLVISYIGSKIAESALEDIRELRQV